MKNLFENKTWTIDEGKDGSLVLINNRKYMESPNQGMYIFVDFDEVKGYNFPKYIKAELEKLFAEIDNKNIVKQAKETVEEADTKFYVEEDQELSIDEVREEIEKIKEGSGVWALNGQIQTGKKFPYVWRDLELVGDEMKYSFVQGLNFKDKIVIYDMDEKSAWNQLLKILKGRKTEMADYLDANDFPEAPAVKKFSIYRKNDVHIVSAPQGEFALTIGGMFNVDYKDEHGEYFIENLLFMGSGPANDCLLMKNERGDILNMDPLKVQRVTIPFPFKTEREKQNEELKELNEVDLFKCYHELLMASLQRSVVLTKEERIEMADLQEELNLKDRSRLYQLHKAAFGKGGVR